MGRKLEMSSQLRALIACLSAVLTQSDRLEGSQEGGNASPDSRCYVSSNAQKMLCCWQKLGFQGLSLHPKNKEGQGTEGVLPLSGHSSSFTSWLFASL